MLINNTQEMVSAVYKSLELMEKFMCRPFYTANADIASSAILMLLQPWGQHSNCLTIRSTALLKCLIKNEVTAAALVGQGAKP